MEKNSQIETLRKLFKRDLNKLKVEIESYQSEENLWKVDKQISNCGGNLCLHLIGNLNTYIAGALGNSNYVRDRVAEFNDKNIPRAKMVVMIDETIKAVDLALSLLKSEELKNDFPVQVFDKKTTTEYMLMHLSTHLNYHLGQVNYHRRLLDE